jgi:hypothetical protein
MKRQGNGRNGQQRRELSAQQQAAVELLAAGKTDKQTARDIEPSQHFHYEMAVIRPGLPGRSERFPSGNLAGQPRQAAVDDSAGPRRPGR